jgi:molybdopterin-guanine dinucleotide biosynthesis protein A
MLEKSQIVGVLLAGGRSRRFGSDKALASLAGMPLVNHVLARAMPQVEVFVVNAARDFTPAAEFGLPLIQDIIGPDRGPLAGLHAGMTWALENVPSARCVASFAVDCPLIPEDLVARLGEASEAGTRVVIAASNGRIHPVFGLWPLAILPRLQCFLEEQGENGVGKFASSVNAITVEFEDTGYDPFINVNRQDEMAQVKKLMGRSIR